MHRALFCAAPARSGPYCAEHRARCLLEGTLDIEALATEIERALAESRRQ